MSKMVCETFNLCFVLYFVCENMIQIVRTLKDCEYKAQFYSCGFSIMNTKMRIHSQKYVTGSQASSMEQTSVSPTAHVF